MTTFCLGLGLEFTTHSRDGKSWETSADVRIPFGLPQAPIYTTEGTRSNKQGKTYVDKTRTRQTQNTKTQTQTQNANPKHKDEKTKMEDGRQVQRQQKTFKSTRWDLHGSCLSRNFILSSDKFDPFLWFCLGLWLESELAL
jgi:hypothetical protein